jgi:hypothetical protein
MTRSQGGVSRRTRTPRRVAKTPAPPKGKTLQQVRDSKR